jgi:hypothetical protein
MQSFILIIMYGDTKLSFIESLVTRPDLGFLENNGNLFLLPQQGNMDRPTRDAKNRVERVQRVVVGLRSLSSEAIRDLCDLKLTAFDEVVCDCACQIRAVEIAVFSKQFLGTGSSFSERIDRLFRSLCDVPLGLSPFRSTDLGIIVLSHILHRIKGEVVKQMMCRGCGGEGDDLIDKTRAEMLSNVLGDDRVSKSIVNRAQSTLATMSCHRLVELVQVLGLPVGRFLNETVLKRVPLPGNTERLELPCFLSIEAALEVAACKEIPVLIKSKLTDHAFEASSQEVFDVRFLCRSILTGEQASLIQCENIPENQGILVIEGFRARCSGLIVNETLTKHDQRLRSQDLAHLIRINAAAHPQFSSVVTREEEQTWMKGFPELAQRLKNLSLEAESTGCTVKNPSLFVILHVHASTLAEEGFVGGVQC